MQRALTSLHRALYFLSKEPYLLKKICTSIFLSKKDLCCRRITHFWHIHTCREWRGDRIMIVWPQHLLCICAMTHLHASWLIHTCHDSFVCTVTPSHVPWLIRMCHDSSICFMSRAYVPWLIHTWHTCREWRGDRLVTARPEYGWSSVFRFFYQKSPFFIKRALCFVKRALSSIKRAESSMRTAGQVFLGSCIYEWVMSRIWMSHVSYMNESRLTYEYGRSGVARFLYIQMSHVSYFNVSCLIYHIWTSHVSHVGTACQVFPGSFIKRALCFVKKIGERDLSTIEREPYPWSGVHYF